jgi:hypothetical protein
VAAASLLDIVGELDADGDGQVDLREVPPGGGGALADGAEERFGSFGEERVADRAVGAFAGQAQVGPSAAT